MIRLLAAGLLLLAGCAGTLPVPRRDIPISLGLSAAPPPTPAPPPGAAPASPPPSGVLAHPAPAPTPPAGCRSDAECKGGRRCLQGACAEPTPGR